MITARFAVRLALAVPMLAPATTAQGAKPATKAAQSKGLSTEELQARYGEELAEPFVAKGGWLTDYDAARAQAKREGKLIFTYFSRSYAG